MTQIHVTIKSFQWYQIKNTILFIKKIQFLLNYRSMTNPPTKIEKQSNTVTSSVALQRKGQRKNRRCKINKISFTSFPKKRKLFTVLRSPHIDKKSREQFQFVFHKLKLVLNGKNDNKTNLFIFLLKNSEFPGVEMEIILNYHSCLHCL
jgi:ribosomal protein S10